jgi:3-hydroxybutyryl-CoA dehydrogenase
MNYTVIDTGNSHSFPDRHHLHELAAEGSDVLILLGEGRSEALGKIDTKQWKAVLIELENECLGEYTGEHSAKEGSNVLGFARFHLGKDKPTSLLELVRQPNSDADALNLARIIFAAAGLKVACCLDFPGRILNRLIRPYFNEALRRLDENLATSEDMDKTLQLGLGYPEGPISLLERTGLANHYDVSAALYNYYGDKALFPARRAIVAKNRQTK